MSDKVYSVLELSETIGAVLQGDLFHNIGLRGEIQSKSSKGSYTYLTLIDPEAGGRIAASLTVVVGAYCQVESPEYQVGDTVLLRGSLNYYKARGSVSFWPRYLAIDGQGQELLRLQRLKEKLQAEGLFDPAHKRPLPRFPGAIAVVTSASGAAVNDIKSTLKKRFPVHLRVFSALVQGEQAASSIAAQLKSAFEDPECELVIVARGGGSKADLAPFNDERVARLIYSSPVPVISAVGHQIDTSLTDLVADATAITPTDAANLVGPSLAELADGRKRQLNELRERLGQLLRSKEQQLRSQILLLEANSPAERLNNFQRFILKAKCELAELAERRRREEEQGIERRRQQLAAAAPQPRLASSAAQVTQSRHRLEELWFQRLQRTSERLGEQKELLQALAPQKILDRGYALVRKAGRVVRAASDLAGGDSLEIQLKDGRVAARVEDL